MLYFVRCANFIIFVIASFLCCLISGCIWFYVNNIPVRRAFSGSYISQGSMAELRSGYLEHYRIVEDELQMLEKVYNDSEDYPQWIHERIAEHRKYLSEMEAYPFLCPNHQTMTTVVQEKVCPHCKGTGYGLFNKDCKHCLGKGKVSYTHTKNNKCNLCKQYYRGSILGKTLNGNN